MCLFSFLKWFPHPPLAKPARGVVISAGRTPTPSWWLCAGNFSAQRIFPLQNTSVASNLGPPGNSKTLQKTQEGCSKSLFSVSLQVFAFELIFALLLDSILVPKPTQNLMSELGQAPCWSFGSRSCSLSVKVTSLARKISLSHPILDRPRP